jgi:hypothetical protein
MARRILSMKNSSDTIGNLTRDLPACRAVSQPTAPAHAMDCVAPLNGCCKEHNGPSHIKLVGVVSLNSFQLKEWFHRTKYCPVLQVWF